MDARSPVPLHEKASLNNRLFAAVLNDDLEDMVEALAQGADPLAQHKLRSVSTSIADLDTVEDATVLHAAALYRRHRIVRHLVLDMYFDPEVVTGKVSMFPRERRILLKVSRLPVLFCAMAAGDIELFEFLVMHGASIDQKCSKECAPNQVCASVGMPEFLQDMGYFTGIQYIQKKKLAILRGPSYLAKHNWTKMRALSKEIVRAKSTSPTKQEDTISSFGL